MQPNPGPRYLPGVPPAVRFADPPRSEAELLARARSLSGEKLGDLAARVGATAPADLRRAKGWTGQLLERLLGASAASRARPDFEQIDVELKMLPVDRRGRPCESTFVCTIPLGSVADLEWEDSPVWRKLARVLWVPVEGERALAPRERRVGEPLLWSPSDEDRDELRADWQELAGIIGRGDIETLSARVGRWLQVRPKAASSRARRRGPDRDGAWSDVVPRGFYLRATFTARMLERNYRVPA